MTAHPPAPETGRLTQGNQMTPRELILESRHDNDYADMLTDSVFDSMTQAERRAVLQLMIERGDLKLQALVAGVAADICEGLNDE